MKPPMVVGFLFSVVGATDNWQPATDNRSHGHA